MKKHFTEISIALRRIESPSVLLFFLSDAMDAWQYIKDCKEKQQAIEFIHFHIDQVVIPWMNTDVPTVAAALQRKLTDAYSPREYQQKLELTIRSFISLCTNGVTGSEEWESNSDACISALFTFSTVVSERQVTIPEPIS